jgi:hypothetical protein
MTSLSQDEEPGDRRGFMFSDDREDRWSIQGQGLQLDPHRRL